MNDRHYTIGQVGKLLGLSADTLRYYQKLGLISGVPRTPGGARYYRDKELSRLRFIQRAKAMNFSLEEITQLLGLRDAPQQAKDEVRELTRQKLNAIEQQLAELGHLQKELSLLLNLCGCSENGCPIIDSMDMPKSDSNESEL